MTRDDNREPWWDKAACKNTPAHLIDRIWFPGIGKNGKRAHELDEPAKAICAACPVRLECLNYAVDHEILLGTYGGMPDHERRHKFHPGARTDRGKTA
jgi:WhiB family redox-sensing transcriptional regulator